MLIRSHSICPEGIERFPDNLITITSNTNSSGVHNNDASIYYNDVNERFDKPYQANTLI